MGRALPPHIKRRIGMSGKTEKTRIKFEYDGKQYTLEYTAASLKKMERDGFDFTQMESRILSVPEALFSGAFIANHNNVPKQIREEIFHSFSDETENGETLFDVLNTMISEAVEEINYHSGNTKWEVAK